MRRLKLPIHHVAPFLRIRLRAYGFICALLLGVIVADTWRFKVPVLAVLGAVAIGITLGYAFSYSHHITWDSEKGKVVARLDVYGLVLLAFYTALELNRDDITGYFLHGDAFAVGCYAVLAGAVFGRGLGMSRRVLAILRKMNKMPVP
jgi:hypothetical protein